MANTEQYGSGTTPQKSDTERMLMVKELIATNAGGGGGGSGGVSSGAGNPVAAPASSPAIYINTTDGSVWYYYSGGWH